MRRIGSAIRHRPWNASAESGATVTRIRFSLARDSAISHSLCTQREARAAGERRIIKMGRRSNCAPTSSGIASLVSLSCSCAQASNPASESAWTSTSQNALSLELCEMKMPEDSIALPSHHTSCRLYRQYSTPIPRTFLRRAQAQLLRRSWRQAHNSVTRIRRTPYGKRVGALR